MLELIRQASTLGKDLHFIIKTQRKQDALEDCFAVGLVVKELDSHVVLTRTGKRFLANAAEAKEILKEFLLSKPNVVNYLEKVGYNPTLHVKVLKEILADINPGWTQGTWGWRSKVLVNWLAYAELVKRTKGRVTSYPARLF